MFDASAGTSRREIHKPGGTVYTARMRKWEEVRTQIIGRDTPVETPYGPRLLEYADFTASGRGFLPIERYMQRLLEQYANTHTEDDTTGRVTSLRLAAAEELIKRRLHADEHYKIIAVGAGATGAITRLQQILGVFLPPATRDRLQRDGAFSTDNTHRPVVFVGPYEHHSNEISWREGYAEVVEVDLDERGYLDIDDLAQKLSDSRWKGRQKIGSFSAASNVSGIITDVYEVARVLHRHGALAFFDFSAGAPYVRIDVHRDDESYFDGVFFSPHKYLGGPGSSGLLIIHDTIYRSDLPPSVSGGGTVVFVNMKDQDYVTDIEEREKAGTPGILQTIRAALAIDLQHELGIDRIQEREHELFDRAVKRIGRLENVEIIGDAPPEDRLAIFSFNLKNPEGYLHPRFVVRLLNDLFGIQARAGCSCAGPYGHRLLHIDPDTSERYRRYIRGGSSGIKPGWVRLNFHYLMSDEDFDFVCSAVEFVARFGAHFLGDYRFDLESGAWQHLKESPERTEISIAEAFALPVTDPPTVGDDERQELRARYLREAEERATVLAQGWNGEPLNTTTAELIPFVYRNG